LQYKTDNVYEAVWLGCAVLTFDKYSTMLSKGNKIDKSIFWFSQLEIQTAAQELCSKTVHNPRVNQWTNADHSNNSYNYLRGNGELRRLTTHGEFKGNKEVPEDLSSRRNLFITIDGNAEIAIGQLIDWVKNEYNNIIIADSPKLISEVRSFETPVEKVIDTDELSYIELTPYLTDFLSNIKNGEIEIYNEFSVQFELAMYLRVSLNKHYKIQLERNIAYMGLNKRDFLKKEMDIVVFNQSKSEKYCIEIKFSNNGQYPEQMFSICKDIKSLEQLKEHGFTRSYELVIVNSDLYYTNKGGGEIYDMFRKDKLLRGSVVKPTGQKDEEFNLSDEYSLN